MRKWFQDEDLQPTTNQDALQTIINIWAEWTILISWCSHMTWQENSLKWYKKVACHFLQLAMLNSFLVYKKDRGRKRFLEFQHDVISVLLFGTENDQPDIPRKENVVRLTERHFLEQISPTANKRKAQKRCRVCYKKDIRKETYYYCLSCPSQPGLCYYPCFKLYHTKFVYWANTWKTKKTHMKKFLSKTLLQKFMANILPFR